MPPPWNRRLAVGIAEIDDQHRDLIAMIDRISDQIARGEDQDSICRLIAELEAATTRHFADEERLMDAHGYPDAEAHKAEHRRMLDDIRRYSDECVACDGNPKVVLGYLEHWFLRHIADADRRLGAAFAAA